MQNVQVSLFICLLFLASSCSYMNLANKEAPYKVLVADYKLENLAQDKDIVIIERDMTNRGKLETEDVCERELIYMEIYYDDSYVKFYCK